MINSFFSQYIYRKIISFWKCFPISFCFLLLNIVTISPSFAANSAHVGIQFGGIDWGNSLFGIAYDQRGFLQQPKWTLGGELNFLGGGFILVPRFLIWQKANLSGFYGGPALSFGVVKDGHLNSSYKESYSNLLVGLGGEGGYSYRFNRRFDAGGGLELQLTNQGMWMGVKVTGGYTF